MYLAPRGRRTVLKPADPAGSSFCDGCCCHVPKQDIVCLLTPVELFATWLWQQKTTSPPTSLRCYISSHLPSSDTVSQFFFYWHFYYLLPERWRVHFLFLCLCSYVLMLIIIIIYIYIYIWLGLLLSEPWMLHNGLPLLLISSHLTEGANEG